MEILSYLGVIERFMPRNSIRFDKLDPAVQSCIEARDRCTAYVFRPGQLHQERTGSIFLDLLGFERTTVNTGWTAEVVFLVQDGRVAYKVMSGKPNIDTSQDLRAAAWAPAGHRRHGDAHRVADAVGTALFQSVNPSSPDLIPGTQFVVREELLFKRQ